MDENDQALIKAGCEAVSRALKDAQGAVDRGNSYSAKAKKWLRAVKISLWFNAFWTLLNAADTARHIWFPPYQPVCVTKVASPR